MDTKTMIVWVTAIIAAFALLLSPVACTMNRQHLVAEAIKNGADPISAKCAIEAASGDNRTSSLCLAKALGK